MSLSGISSNLSDLTTQNVQGMMQQLKQDFTQLGTDLKAGNLGAAQQDFVTLQQDSGQSATASTAQSQDPIAQAFTQLSKDLQSGNVSAAQQDYSAIQQAFQAMASQQTAGTHHHPHRDADGDSPITSEATQISQLFTQLGQDLQSGNVTTAQQTYSTLQQDLQSAQASTQTTSKTNVSVTA